MIIGFLMWLSYHTLKKQNKIPYLLHQSMFSDVPRPVRPHSFMWVFPHRSECARPPVTSTLARGDTRCDVTVTIVTTAREGSRPRLFVA